MIIFSNTTKLMTLVWLMNILSTKYCEANNSEINCIIAPEEGVQGINSREIPTVKNCIKGYENKTIIERCEFLINRDQPFESKLYRPVINNSTDKVYWNTYCATCNNDTVTRSDSHDLSFKSWNTYYDRSRCSYLANRIQKSEIGDIQNLTRIFVREGEKLVAKRFDSTQLECSMDGKWPFPLLFYVISCLDHQFITGQSRRLRECQYAEKNGRICTEMGVYTDGHRFSFQNGAEIDYNETLSTYNNFNPGQYYVETEYPGVFYICEQPATIYMGKHSVKISIAVISLIFVIINLGINTNRRYIQQNNANKLLYLYMVGLIPMNIILLLIYFSHPVACVAFYLARFLWAYHFFWSLIIFFEFYLLTYCTKYNRSWTDILYLGLKYLVYFIIGVAIPLALPIIYYFGVLVINENYKEDLSQPSSSTYHYGVLQYTCPIIPNHLGVSCTSYETFGSGYYEGWLNIFLSVSSSFFVPLLFLSISAVVCFHFVGIRSGNAQSISYRDQLIVITKMTSIMGIHWVLLKIYQSYGGDNSTGILGVSLDTLCQLSIDFHGLILFILFMVETFIGFIMKLCGCDYKTVSQKEGNDDMEIS